MKVLPVFLALCVAFSGAQQSLEEFIVSLMSSPAQLSTVIKQLYVQSGNRLPAEVSAVLSEKGYYFNPTSTELEQEFKPDSQPSNSEPPIPKVPKIPKVEKYNLQGMEDLTQKEKEALNAFMDQYRGHQNYKRDNYTPPKLKKRVPGLPCFVDDDCPKQHFCFDIKEALRKDLYDHGYPQHFQLFTQALNIGHNECKKQVGSYFPNGNATYLANLGRAFDKIKKIFNRTHDQEGFKTFLDNVEYKIKNFNYDVQIEEEIKPMTRQFGYDQGGFSDMLLPLLLISSLDDTNNGIDIGTLLIFSMLAGQSGGGQMGGGLFGGDLMSSPFLLFALLGNDNSGSGSDLMTILLLSSFSGGGSNDYILPLYLILAQEENDNSLLPLLLLGGGGLTGGSSCGGGSNPLITLLLFQSLLGNNNNNDNSNLILFLMLGGQGCPGGSGGFDPFQLILFQTLLGGNNNNNGLFGGNPLITLLLLSGLGGTGSGGMDSPLLLLALLDDSLDVSTLLPIIFLSDPNFAADPLTLLLLFSGDVFGSGNSNLLFILLFLTQGQMGLTGTQTVTTNPYAVTGTDPMLPPPGGPAAGTSYTTGGSSVTPTGGLGGLFNFGGADGGFGIFQYFLLSTLLGGTNDDTNIFELLLLIMIMQGNLGTGGVIQTGNSQGALPGGR